MLRISIICGLWFITTCVFAQSGEEQCYNARQQPGVCIDIRQCRPYIEILQKRPISSTDADFLKRSQCGFIGAYPKVCCPNGTSGGTSGGTTGPSTPVIGPGVTGPVTSNQLPGKNICGVGSQDRIVGGEKTELDEFIWMALIEYQKPNGRGFYCGGVLINSRYVLTAAHCIKGKDLPRTWKVVSVRLGEYNTETDIDCISDGFGNEDCAPPPVNVPVEAQIPHEQYNPQDTNQYNDIALLRLARDVEFTDFIRPICLPTTQQQLENRYIGSQMFVAGWGKTESRSESPVKLKLQIPVKSNAECANVYSRARVTIANGQLCAGGESGKDSCRGDSGGPLMTVHTDKQGDSNWYCTGIVSFGPSPCGMAGWPGVYTRVTDYAAWIVSKLRP